ncbi:NAD-binding protein [Streptomyces sp. PT12]|uniref:NAD-binding protein n=1 Tax=Streptomyces sp. PT12 TaxID=1510197 RepID=UPI0015EF2F2E|nr:NAD-binding protein [Streptomyces sp. PT12]
MATPLHALRRTRARGLTEGARRRGAPGAQDRRVAVIGLGGRGGALADELTRRGLDVLGVDADEQAVSARRATLARVAVADVTDPGERERLGLAGHGALPGAFPRTFPRAVVALGAGGLAGLVVASELVEGGIPDVWVHAPGAHRATLARRLGARPVDASDATALGDVITATLGVNDA